MPLGEKAQGQRQGHINARTRLETRLQDSFKEEFLCDYFKPWQ